MIYKIIENKSELQNIFNSAEMVMIAVKQQF